MKIHRSNRACTFFSRPKGRTKWFYEAFLRSWNLRHPACATPMTIEEKIALDKVQVLFVHEGEHYQVATPWKHEHPALPINYEMAFSRLRNTERGLTYETPLAGHLGVNKTFQKILDHFYWPNLRKDVAEYCKSCLAQMVGKPNQTIRKAPLQSPPVIQEPFSRIIVDCVGPLTKTRSGNQYVVTIHARIHQISWSWTLEKCQCKD